MSELSKETKTYRGGCWSREAGYEIRQILGSAEWSWIEKTKKTKRKFCYQTSWELSTCFFSLHIDTSSSSWKRLHSMNTLSLQYVFCTEAVCTPPSPSSKVKAKFLANVNPTPNEYKTAVSCSVSPRDLGAESAQQPVWINQAGCDVCNSTTSKAETNRQAVGSS